IGGTVRDRAGQPIANAWVYANRETCCWSGGARTDASGAYTLIDLPAGSYRLQASADGYAAAYYAADGGALDWGLAAPVAVADGQAVAGVDIALPRLGAISGTVRDR